MKLKAVFVFALAAFSVLAAEPEEHLPKTLMTERGKLLYREDFATLDAKSWHAAKGNWAIAGGALRGMEVKSDHHPAVIRHQFPFKDAVIQFEVQVNGSKQTTFSINDAREHLARVLFYKTGFVAQKDDHDHDGPDKAMVFGRIAMPMKPGEWHTVLIEFEGEEMVVTMDGRTIAGSHRLIGTPKANFGFTVAGESASYRNLRVWEARPNPAWDQNRKMISAAKN